MSTRYSDNDGSGIFWPGYVDAVTNLVLNLLFLLTIMTVAVFMFALELGRASKLVPPTPPVASVKQEADVVSKAATDSVKENIALKREIQRLNMQLAQRVSQKVQNVRILEPAQPAKAVRPGQPVKLEQPEQTQQHGGLVETVDVTASVPKPLKGLVEALRSDSEVSVNFVDEAVTFTQEEHDTLREKLQPIVASGKARIFVEVPAGFSEAKRMGYYRVMAVRNILLEMKMPNENIETSVVDGKTTADASLVRVR